MPSSESVLLVPNALAVADENKGVCGLLVGHGVESLMVKVSSAVLSGARNRLRYPRHPAVLAWQLSRQHIIQHLDIAGDIACWLRYQTALGSGNILGWNRIGYDMIWYVGCAVRCVFTNFTTSTMRKYLTIAKQVAKEKIGKADTVNSEQVESEREVSFIAHFLILTLKSIL